MTMVYRATISNIQAYIENYYNIDMYQVVTDASNKYMEFKDAEEASLVEAINRAQSRLNKAIVEHQQYIAAHR